MTLRTIYSCTLVRKLQFFLSVFFFYQSFNPTLQLLPSLSLLSQEVRRRDGRKSEALRLVTYYWGVQTCSANWLLQTSVNCIRRPSLNSRVSFSTVLCWLTLTPWSLSSCLCMCVWMGLEQSHHNFLQKRTKHAPLSLPVRPWTNYSGKSVLPIILVSCPWS